MNQVFARVMLGLGVCLLAAGVVGCSKRVPVENGAFEAQQKVVLTFKEGRSLSGRIAPGNRVEYREKDAVYWGRVASVDEESIQIEALVLLERSHDFSAVSKRLADSRKRITDPVPPVTISRKDMEKVELVRTDAGKSFRKIAFWTYSGALLVLLLGERS
jgi:hypothetical protein